MWLFVGLGNPGDEYARNRHNVGFMAIDEIASDHGAPNFRSKFQGLYSDVRIGGQKVGLLKPQTFMNESGRSIAAAAKFFKIPPERVVVFHDELDIPERLMKVKSGGGTAGHNGLKSTQAHLGTADFLRIRIGIDHPGDRNKVSNYVLSDFAKTVYDSWLNDMLSSMSKHIALLLDDDLDVFSATVRKETRLLKAGNN